MKNPFEKLKANSGVGIRASIPFLLTLMHLLFISGCSVEGTAQQTPRATEGVLDLRNWNFDKDGPVELNGEWAFYWKKFIVSDNLYNQQPLISDGYIPVPSRWNGFSLSSKETLEVEGFSSYRLQILLPPEPQQMAVHFSYVQSAHRVYIVDNKGSVRQLGAIGKPSKNERTSVTHVRPFTARFTGSDEIILIHEVSNYQVYDGSGLTRESHIGSEKDIFDNREQKKAIHYFVVGCILILGLYDLMLFILRPNEKATLWLTLFCINFAFFTLIQNEYLYLEKPSILFFHIWMKSWSLFPILMAIFFVLSISDSISSVISASDNISETFQHLIKDKIKSAIIFIAGLYCFGILILPLKVITFFVPLTVIVIFLVCLWGVYINIDAIVRYKNKTGLISLIGILPGAIAVINDSLNELNILNTGQYMHLAFLVFVICQAFVVAIKNAMDRKTAEIYGDKIKKQSLELQKLDKLKDEFLSNTSHELRTPLHGIIGIVQSLIDGACGNLSEKAAHNLSLVEMSVKRLSNLVNDILDFSRLKHKDMALQLSPVDLRPLVDIVIDISTPLIGKKDVAIANDIDHQIPLVEADENKLQQILFNLIGNAIKFTPSGSIRLSAVVSLPPFEKSDSQWVTVTVSDTGIGIDASRLDQIFEAFEQADGSIARTFGGTGIGLSIVKKLVELQGGDISVVSRVNKGSAFSFTLKVSEDQDKATIEIGKDQKQTLSTHRIQPEPPDGNTASAFIDFATDTAPNQGRPKGRILVVDDDPVNLQVIVNFLSPQNYAMVLARNGFDALETIHGPPPETDSDNADQQGFDLVLLDIMMPQISGYEVCRKIRKTFSLYELPIIILTARNHISDLIAGFDAGANDYLTKPVTKDELLVRVKTHITLKQSVTEYKEARYKLLQDRMNPHFLFNTLNSIHAYIYDNVDLADQALLKLAHNYRFLIDTSSKTVIDFEEEWTFLINYLEIEKIRFHDILTISTIKTGDFTQVKIPPLTLQPIVENAIKHGLSGVDGVGEIRIMAGKKGNTVHIAFRDNGIGLQKEDLFSRSLGNIRRRLNHIYPESELLIHNAKGGGVIVRVTFTITTASGIKRFKPASEISPT